MIRLAVVDDHAVFREGVISVLSREQGIEVVGEGACADDAVRIADTLPDIILLDVEMPGGGINAVERISRSYPLVRLLMLTVSENGTDVIRSFEAGASGYVLKGIMKSDLVNAVYSVHRGEAVISPNLAARILGRFGRPTGVAGASMADDAQNNAEMPPHDQLTQREEEVLILVSEGMTNKEVAERLKLSDRTIKNYMSSVMLKLQVRNRVEAVLKLQQMRR